MHRIKTKFSRLYNKDEHVTFPWRDALLTQQGFVLSGLAVGDILPSPDTI